MGLGSKNLKLSTKFTLVIGLIIFIFCIIFSVLLYFHLKNRVIEDANEKTLIILAQIDALGNYIKNTLRPKIFEYFQSIERDNDFLVEAMSTTHVTQEVMRRFNIDLKDYVYKRVSISPLNPKNRADKLHEGLIDFFRKNKGLTSWNGIMKIEGEDFLIRAKAIIVERDCLTCHGDPSRAPKGLIRRYGTTSGFGWKEGDIMGVESVTIPIAVALAQVKDIAISTFVFGFITMVFLFISLEGAFWRLVSKPLNMMTTHFNRIVKGTEPLNQTLPIERGDEIGELTASFNQMARHLFDAQEGMREQTETLRSIIESISDPLALVNPDCSLDITNKTYRDWVARGSIAVFTKKCHSENCDADTLCPVCFLEKVKREKRSLSEYWEGYDNRYYYIHLYPVFDEKSEVIKVVHYVKDITEKKEMEEQMRLTEKMAAIGQLSAGIAHEINNPLGGIRLCFNNLISTEMDEETKKKHIEVINTGLERIQVIIKQLLDFSKKTTLSVSPVSVDRLIDNVLKLIEYSANKRGIKIIKSRSDDVPEIMVDRNKMEQVFLNIILNAVQAINGPGIIKIETSINNGQCIISFKDTGPGISPDVMPYIFDPFFTTKSVGEGTGLGLSVSKSIVEQHGGKITVESTEGMTEFKIQLPIAIKV